MSFAIGPKNLKLKGSALAITPHKRLAALVLGSPKLEAPATPTPSVIALLASHPHTICCYCLPLVKDVPKEPEVLEASVPEPDACTS